MPSSPARIAANQQNALRSTGPKTEEGKARSRLNAFRHGLAGAGDLVGPNEDQTRIDQRTETFARELNAPGTLGATLARRAAVLSVRLEQASDRDLQAVAANAQAGRERFDDDRATLLDDWLIEAEAAAEPAPALRRLEGTPEGVRHLGAVWRGLRSAVADNDPAAIERATRWLGPNLDEPVSSRDLTTAIDAEVARLDRLVDSPLIQAAARRVEIERGNAGKIASFDPSPEATLARRYEAAAERGLYRAIRAIHELRRDPASIHSIPAPGPAATTPPGAPVAVAAPDRPIHPPLDPRLGSFRNDLMMVSAGRTAPAVAPLTTPPTRPDPRQLVKNRQ